MPLTSNKSIFLDHDWFDIFLQVLIITHHSFSAQPQHRQRITNANITGAKSMTLLVVFFGLY